MSTKDSNGKSRVYRWPTPLFVKSNSPMTITDGKFTTSHTGIIVFHGDNIEFELEETQQKLLPVKAEGHVGLSASVSVAVAPQLPDGYKLYHTTEAKVLAHDRKRSKYEIHKRDKDISYICIIRRNGTINPPIHLGSLLDPESMISIALREFSKTPIFMRRDLKPANLPTMLGQGQRIKACLDVLEKEGYLTKMLEKVGLKQTIEKYVRTDKKSE